MKFEKYDTLKEALEVKSSMTNAGEFSEENKGIAPVVYSDAINMSKKNVKKINDEMKDKQKEVDEVVKDNEVDSHDKLPKTDSLKKLKLSEATATLDLAVDTRDDPLETFEDYDMFVFITNLFTRDLKGNQRPLNPLGRNHKHFEYLNKGDTIGEGSQVGVTRNGDIILKSDKIEDFDDVKAICDKYKFSYIGPKEAKNDTYKYYITVIVPKTKGGYPLNVEDYFESIGINPVDVLPKWYFNIKKRYNKKYGIEEDYIQRKDESVEKQAENIADYLSQFLNDTSNIENLSDYLDEYDIENLTKSIDALYYFAQNYKSSKINVKESKSLKEADEDIIKTRDDLNKFEPWEGAVHTLDKIKEADKLDSLEAMLKEMYPKGITVEKLNNLLWFEDDWIYSMLNIKSYDED
jgi:hypothetical protein